MFGNYLQRRRKARHLENAAAKLYLSTVNQAREIAFYRDIGVPDTLDGRFEMIAVHAYLIMRRLKNLGDEGNNLSQALFDAMFKDMDRNLRELGVSDMSMGKRMKKMMQGFYGRVAAYDTGMDAPDNLQMKAAIRRNLYGTIEPEAGWIEVMLRYIQKLAEILEISDYKAFEAAQLKFPKLDN